MLKVQVGFGCAVETSGVGDAWLIAVMSAGGGDESDLVAEQAIETALANANTASSSFMFV